jgi:hypothetical protein
MLSRHDQTRRRDVDTTRFLDYLHDAKATETLAGALAELILVRRAAADRRAIAARARAQRQMCVAV